MCKASAYGCVSDPLYTVDDRHCLGMVDLGLPLLVVLFLIFTESLQ